MAVSGTEWITFCCKQLVSGLTANDAMRYMTGNTDLIGGYAEASVREFIRRFVFPLRLSCGSIVYEGNCGDSVPQLDAIIWHPCPLPPVVEAGEFAMIPRSAGLAFLEVKRSNYSEIGKQMKKNLCREDELVPLWPGESTSGRVPRRAMGIVCLYTEGKSDRELDDLITQERVAVILRRSADQAEYEPDTKGIILLATFLMGVRRRSAYLDGRIVPILPSECATLPGLGEPPSMRAVLGQTESPVPSGLQS